MRTRTKKTKKSPSKSLLIKNALLVATMDDARTLIPGGDVYIEDNLIKETGKSLRKKADRTLDASGCVVLPGFVNMHHHLYQTFNRNLPAVQNAKLFDWLVYLYEIWRHVSPEWVFTSAQLGLGELLLTGCTTSTDHFYVFPRNQPKDLFDSEIAGAKEIGIRFHPCRGSMSRGKSDGGLPPDDVVQDEDEILKDSERVIAKFHDASKYSMCRVALAPCSPFSVTDSLLRQTADMARKKNVRCHTHLAETKDEEEFCLKLHGARPVDYMEQTGWLGENIWFAHSVYMNDEEIRKLARTKTGVAHCPSSNLRLGSGIAPIRKMLDAGVRVGIGVDGSASNDSSDMLGELRQAMLVHRVTTGVESMPASDVFWMATRNGAKILGQDDAIGSLEPGKAADIAIFDLNKLGYAGAMTDPLAALLYCGDSHIAKWVLVNGRIVVEQGMLTTINEDALIKKANRLAAKYFH